MTITNGAQLAAVAVLAVALAGTACSGESNTSTRTADTSQKEAASSEAPEPREADANLTTAKFRVKGMTCGGCAVATEMAVKKLDGVESADAEYLGGEKSGRCTVTFDPSVVGTEQIASAIEGAGYDPTLASTSSGS